MSSCISLIILSYISSNNWCYVSRGRNIGLLHRSILIVKSLKRTLYSLPKATLMSPSTPLHDVNVTSIYQHTKTHNLNLFIFWQIYILISSWRGSRIDVVFSLHTHRKSVKKPHLFLLLRLPFRKITSLSFLSIIYFWLSEGWCCYVHQLLFHLCV